MHLEDAEDRPLTPAQFPPSLERTTDDTYRSLAWRVRKEDGFCRAEMPWRAF